VVVPVPAGPAASPEMFVRQLEERDLPEADRIMRLAFGTFIGLPDPMAFMGDGQYVRTRWKTNPSAAFAAEHHGEVVGSNFATNWGTVGFFGPLTVRPDLWDRGVGKLLMQPLDECFAQWGTRHAGLFTFAQSQKHVGLYQKFGFWPRFLTAVMSKPAESPASDSHWTTLSELSTSEQETTLRYARELTDEIYSGLDLGDEIRAVNNQQLGDTVLLWENSKLIGFAVCHMGAGTEAGSGTCYIKFGVVRPGSDAGSNFDRLLDACGDLASAHKLTRVVAGVNTARINAYQQMLGRGFRTDMQGVAMHRPNEAGYNRPNIYLIDDWR
jgi:GNAT superfamily N-acetyltransferase